MRDTANKKKTAILLRDHKVVGKFTTKGALYDFRTFIYRSTVTHPDTREIVHFRLNVTGTSTSILRDEYGQILATRRSNTVPIAQIIAPVLNRMLEATSQPMVDVAQFRHARRKARRVEVVRLGKDGPNDHWIGDWASPFTGSDCPFTHFDRHTREYARKLQLREALLWTRLFDPVFMGVGRAVTPAIVKTGRISDGVQPLDDLATFRLTHHAIGPHS